MNAQKFRFVLVGLTIASLAASAAAGYFGVVFLQQNVTEANKLKIEAEVNDAARTSATRAANQFDDPRVQKLYDSLIQVIPKASYREQFLADVKKYGDSSGVPITSVTFMDQTAGGPTATAPKIKGAKAIPIQIATGTEVPYDNFINFLGKLENNLQHIQVLDLSMQPSSTDRSVLSSVSLSVAIYVEQ